LHSYARFNGVDLPHTVGINSESGFRRADGRSGHLSHGPYINLMPGQYTAAFYVRREENSDFGAIDIDVCAEHGTRYFAEKSFTADDICTTVAGLLKLDFVVDAPAKACEVRLRVPEAFILEIRDLVIFRRTHSSWGAQ
jgi:hypothetical protein